MPCLTEERLGISSSTHSYLVAGLGFEPRSVTLHSPRSTAGLLSHSCAKELTQLLAKCRFLGLHSPLL